MYASSSKHVLNTALRRPQICGKSQPHLTDLRKFLLSDFTNTRCVHTKQREVRRDRRQTPVGPQSHSRQQQRRPPFSFQHAKPHIQVQPQFERVTKITYFNAKIQELCREKRLGRILQMCTKMKQDGILPDITTYKLVLRMLADAHMFQETWATLKDMQAMGIEPDQEVFNIVLRGGQTKDNMIHILAIMSESGLINAQTYDAIIGFYIENENLDMALHKLAEMNDLDMTPGLETAQRLIVLAVQTGYPRLALDLALAYENTSVRRIDTETWMKLLTASAQNLYGDGVQYCWDKVTKDLKASVYEGLCISVLHTAARHGLPSLAASVLDALEGLKVPLREYHLSPVLEALAVNGRIKEAFAMLALIRASGYEPTVATAQPILDVIQRDPDTLDDAYSALEELVTKGDHADIVSANVIIEAADSMSDIQRAIGVYKALDTLKLKPNCETFNVLMKVCYTCSHHELANRLFKDMTEAGIKPDTTTYRHLIGAHLTQTNYEEAFYYLEDMKGRGLKPTYPIYESIVRKCVVQGDSRYRLAVEEIKQMGYEVKPNLQRFIETGGEGEKQGKFNRHHSRVLQ